jgi:DNA-binding MarR family transcriptional regulator
VSRPDDDVRKLLRAYFDAVALSDSLQDSLWHTSQLTLEQVRVLRRLAKAPLALGQLGADLNLSPTSMTRLIDRLEVRGLVERRRDAPDRRVVVAALTASGQKLVSALPLFEQSSLRDAAEAMPAARRSAITAALEELVGAVREVEESPAGARR